MVRQDWGRFDLDAFFPMLYHGFYEAGPEWVLKYTMEAVRTLTLAGACVLDGPPCSPGRPSRARLFSGLYIADLPAEEFARTIDMALAGGADGVSIFEAGAMTDDRWALFAKAVAGR